MINTDYFKNKKIVIVGLARSGLACANLLYDLGSKVKITEAEDNPVTRLNCKKLKSKNIRFELGRHTRTFIEDADLMVVSPGVTDKAKPVIWAKKLNIPVVSEIEVGFILCPATIIAVTGSSGKTTVTTLIGKVLEASGKRVFVCGNIGKPFSGEVAKTKSADFVVLEVSSFQLEKIRAFKPKIAVMLNFSCNHLDRHRDMREYLEAKKRIFMNQGKDSFAVLNSQDKIVKALAKEIRAKSVFFKKTAQFNPNQAAALAVASILAIDKKLCQKVFRDFQGIEHRLEYVGEINNIRFINDSKATTAESTVWALENIDRPIVLIAGGRDKGIKYDSLLPIARKKVKQVVLIGEAKKKIGVIFKKFLPVEEALTLKEAVTKAYSKAVQGDCVIMSPMCSSFDMFNDYEHRGRVFKKIVHDLINSKAK